MNGLQLQDMTWVFCDPIQEKGSKSDHGALLHIGTVAMGYKSLWPKASGPSLLKRRYSGISVATTRRCPLLLCIIVATGVLTSFARRYSSPK
jgi:hypothetical protein